MPSLLYNIHTIHPRLTMNTINDTGTYNQLHFENCCVIRCVDG